MNRLTKPLLASAALCAATVLPAHAEIDAVTLKAAIEKSVEADYPKLDALYKDIHAHPEIAFQEVKTAARLATEMRALGFEVTEKVGKTGLVAIYKNGEGPTIMVRTELDALPMEEKTGLAYASHDKTEWHGRETFVAHSCGHDIHMASWVGTAKTLVGLKDRWQGTLMFIAQPAEEIVSGAKAMLDDGLFTRFKKPDFGFALHDGAFAYGNILYRSGIGSSNSDGLYIKFFGRGGHGAAPQATIDPVMIAARFVVDVQSVISREKDPTEFGVVSIGAIHGAAARNHPHLQARGARQNAGRDRADGKGRRRDVGCARAGDQDHRGRQGGHERSRRGRNRSESVEDSLRRQIQYVAAGNAQRGLFRIHQRRRAVDVLQHRRLRAGTRRRGA
jgi:hippurate hydrolase